MGNRLAKSLFAGGHLRRLAPVGASLLMVLALAGAAQGRWVTAGIDFSVHGGGRLSPDYFAPQGVVFTPEPQSGWEVSPLIQGDAALLGTAARPIVGRFTTKARNVAVRVAQAFQGTYEYTLKVYNPGGVLKSSSSLRVVQDLGDPANQGFGYRTLSAPSQGVVQSFRLEVRLIGCSGVPCHAASFGLSTITFESHNS